MPINYEKVKQYVMRFIDEVWQSGQEVWKTPIQCHEN